MISVKCNLVGAAVAHWGQGQGLTNFFNFKIKLNYFFIFLFEKPEP
jgi:hypothetical protein